METENVSRDRQIEIGHLNNQISTLITEKEGLNA